MLSISENGKPLRCERRRRQVFERDMDVFTSGRRRSCEEDLLLERLYSQAGYEKGN